MTRKQYFSSGLKDGMPICFGYFAVSFAFGIQAAGIGLSVFEASVLSALNVTSAGQFAALAIIASGASLIELAFTQLIINLRYFLMSCALSQKLSPSLPLGHRLGIAYGMTECGPIICHSPWYETAYMSCGRAADGMELKVLSSDPERIPGELVCRGRNTMLGYYKNQEATEQIFDADGWLHTGDMAVINPEGDVYIKGRCKNMLLSASGQNIYPEEIESRLNNLPYVNESLVIMCNEKLVALVYPDLGESLKDGLDDHALWRQIDISRQELNKELPPYSQITKVVLQNEEFEKTAKKSIKRYLYQNMNP